MRSNSFEMAVAIAALMFMVGTVSAQTATTSTQVKEFEVVSVDGNTVVVRGAEGAREITVSNDFRLTVDGRPIAVHDLKPGMTGTARITETTVVTPVQVTEVKNGQVVKVMGTSIIVRTPEGNKMFSESEVSKRGVKITVDGKPVSLTELREGTRLTATIVTTGPPRVLTQREVDVAIQSSRAASPAPPAVSPAAPPTPSPASAESARAATNAPARQLPKTGSVLPLVGMIGFVSTTVGLLLTVGRRRRL